MASVEMENWTRQRKLQVRCGLINQHPLIKGTHLPLINSISNVLNCLPDGITYATLINRLCKAGRLEEAK